MESITSAERRVWPGKTVSPRPTKLKAWAYKEFKIGKLFSAQTGDIDLQQKDRAVDAIKKINDVDYFDYKVEMLKYIE